VTLLVSSLFAIALADQRFWLALTIAVLAGVARGFSGFGSALIYMPLVAARQRSSACRCSTAGCVDFHALIFAIRASDTSKLA
jgi:hypothetical protein